MKISDIKNDHEFETAVAKLKDMKTRYAQASQLRGRGSSISSVYTNMLLEIKALEAVVNRYKAKRGTK